jgi:hypothetical protein
VYRNSHHASVLTGKFFESIFALVSCVMRY